MSLLCSLAEDVWFNCPLGTDWTVSMLVAQATELLIIVCIYKNEYVEVDFLNNLKVEICYVYISELGYVQAGRFCLVYWYKIKIFGC